MMRVCFTAFCLACRALDLVRRNTFASVAAAHTVAFRVQQHSYAGGEAVAHLVRRRQLRFGSCLLFLVLVVPCLTPSGSLPAALRDIAHAVHTWSRSPSNALLRPAGRADSVVRCDANGWRFPRHTETPGW